jgi:prepilin-type N-terminal cleavage/methylation domain-containing protein
MENRTISTSKRLSSRAVGWTLVEMMVALSVFSVGILAMGSLYLFSIKSFAVISNYSSLDTVNRQAMDKLTQEIRQAVQVTSYSSNPPSLSILNGNGLTVTYTFSPAFHQMVRSASDGTRQVLLNNCNLLSFGLYQRNPSNANFGVFPLGAGGWAESVKMVQLTWKTAITNYPSGLADSENVQTARIVIRKQQN